MSVRQAPRHDGAAQHLTLPAFGKQSSIGAAFGRPHHLCRDRESWLVHACVAKARQTIAKLSEIDGQKGEYGLSGRSSGFLMVIS